MQAIQLTAMTAPADSKHAGILAAPLGPTAFGKSLARLALRGESTRHIERPYNIGLATLPIVALSCCS